MKTKKHFFKYKNESLNNEMGIKIRSIEIN